MKYLGYTDYLKSEPFTLVTIMITSEKNKFGTLALKICDHLELILIRE